MNKKVLIFLFAFFLYAGTFHHSYVLDDNDIILNNELTHKGFSAIPVIFKTSYRANSEKVIDDLYRPLSRSLFAIEWEFWRGKPGAGHVINAFLYAVLCLLIYNLLVGYFKETKIPLLSALLFAALPVHVEAVANIKSADELLALIFSVCSLIFIFKYFNTGKTSNLIIGLLSFFVSLFAKESAIAFVVIIPLSIYFFTPVNIKRNLSITSLFLIPVVTYLFIRYQVIGQFNAKLDNTSNYLVSAGSFVTQKSSAIMLLGYYLLIMILPFKLMSDGSFDEFPVVSFYDLRFLIPLAIFIAAFVFALINFKRKRPEAFFILYFFISTSIVSNIFFLIGTNYGERLMLGPSLAVCTLASIFLFKLFPDKKKSKIQVTEKKPIYIAVIVLVFYTSITYLRAADWKDEFTLFSKDAQTASNSARAQYYFGNQFAVKVTLYGYSPELQEDATTALDALHRAIEIRPDYHEAYYSLGEIFAATGNIDSAVNNYKRAAEISPTNVRYLNNYGDVMGRKGNLEIARKYFKQAATIDSTYRDAWLNLGITYCQFAEQFRKQSAEAKEKSDLAGSQRLSNLSMANSDTALFYVNKSVAIDPNNAYGYQVLGIIYNVRNEKEKANEYYTKAQSLK